MKKSSVGNINLNISGQIIPFHTRLLIKKWLKHYQNFVNVAVHGSKIDHTNIFTYWQNKTFAILVMYVMPACILALLPSIILEIKDGNYIIATIDLLAFVVAYLTALYKKISLYSRKIAVVVVISLFSISQLISGSFVLAIIYLFALSIFITLQFPTKTAIIKLLLKCTLFLFCSVFFYYNGTLLTANLGLTFSRWIIYTSNFLFVDFIVVIILAQLLRGLEKTMFKKTILYSQLEKEITFKAEQNQLLIQSRQQYLTLFSKSPVAVCIIESTSKKFIQVNNAALSIYGHSESEFLNLKVDDLKLKEIGAQTNRLAEQPFSSLNVTKSGEIINVEVHCTDIVYDGTKANLMIITNTTDKVKQLNDIKRQNEKLTDIAFMQSHTVRVPVANIKGLTHLILDSVIHEEDKEILNHLKNAVDDLDRIISNIVTQAN